MNELAQLGLRMKNCDVDVNVDSDSDVAIASAVISFVVSVVVVVAVSSLFWAWQRGRVVTLFVLADWRTADSGQWTTDSGQRMDGSEQIA